MALHPVHLRVNLLPEPLGIDTPQPEFSWQLASDQSAVLQSAYQIQVAGNPSFDTICWDSQIVVSDLPWGARYAGAVLESCRRYMWRVRVWDQADQSCPWSDPSWFETAFLPGSGGPDAQWISRKALAPRAQRGDRDVLYFHHDVDLPRPIRQARIYATSLGWYKLIINGVNVTGRAQVPRWTPYEHHLEYQVLDVGTVLRKGQNRLGAIVADGHYRGENNGLSNRNCYGDRLAFFCLLIVELDNGQRIECRTDTTWTVTTGCIIRSDPKAGEAVDFRIPDPLDTEDSSSLPAWDAVDLLPTPTKALITEETGRVDEIQRRTATRVWWSPSGQVLVDFGQNITGHVRAVLRGDCGTTVTLTFSEVLTLEGEINLAYLEPVGKDRAQRDEVVLSGSQEGDCFEPLFTIHGFQYVALTGLQYLPALSEVEAAIVSSRLSSPSSALAEFECSDPRLNQLFRNTVWSFLGNFTDTATDCPTRERSGWTGDLQMFGSAAMLLARDVQSFLRRYLRNLQAEQWPDGRIPPFIPSGDSTFGSVSWLSRLTASSVGWGDVSVLLPWQMYLHFGDTHVLERQYASMERWVGFLTGLASNRRSWRRWLRAGPAGVEQYIVDTGFHWGEWLRPGETGLLSMVANLFVWPSAAVPTAFLAESSRILSKISGVLGRPQDEASYRDLTAHVRRAWAASFVRDGGRRIGHDKQDDYVRAVTYDLVSGAEKEAAVGRLAELVQQTGYHLGTGFLSTASLVPTLCENGHSEHAFRLLLQTTPPSWLYAVERGATTIWESWEGCSADGRAVLSQNHYALGAIVDWLLRGLVGINAVSPGWRHVRIAPHIGGGITHARASVNTNFGRLSCAWRIDGVTTGVDVWIELQVPPGTTADVQVADSTVYSVASGAHRLQLSDGRWTAHEP